MSQWTHVAGVIRYDAVQMLTGMQDRELVTELAQRFGGEPWDYNTKTPHPRSPAEDRIPAGSEGSIQYRIELTGDASHLSRVTVVFWGDLRDFEDADVATRLKPWLGRVIDVPFAHKPGICGVRQGVFQAVVEYGPVYIWRVIESPDNEDKSRWQETKVPRDDEDA